MGWRAYKAFQPAVPLVAGHCYLFGGLYGQVDWSLGITLQGSFVVTFKTELSKLPNSKPKLKPKLLADK
jgi:hypothetical protein